MAALALCGHGAQALRHSHSLNKNLKLRAVVFTMDVLCGNTTVVSAPPPPLQAKAPAPSPTYDTSKEIEGIATVTSKYMNKIAKRLGGSNPLASPPPGARGDGDIHAAGKQMLQQEQQRGRVSAADTGRWVLAEGMGGVLDYASSRTLCLAVLPLQTQTPTLLQTLLAQTNDVPWLFVGTCYSAGRSSSPDAEAHVAADIVLAETGFSQTSAGSIVPKQIVLVSGDESALAHAKARGIMTCRFRPPNAPYTISKAGSTDFTAESALEVQDALESLNGIALRQSAYGMRSF